MLFLSSSSPALLSTLRRGGSSAFAVLCCGLLLAVGCGGGSTGDGPGSEEISALQGEVDSFLQDYNDRFVELYSAASEAEWASNTRIVEGDDTNRKRTEAAQQALASYTGSLEVIEQARLYLERRDDLTPLSARQLESVLYRAANFPQTVPELVEQRIAAEAKANEELFGFTFELDGEPIDTNRIDSLLESVDDLDRRQEVWTTSKEVGRVLREDLTSMVDLRNSTVASLGYDDYFAYQVSDYGMTSQEMMDLLQGLVRDIWPLYRELHTWTRYELAERYGTEVPELLPAHWLPNRWAQDWQALVEVEGQDLDGVLGEHEDEWIVRQAEDFYVSLGFEPLPETFWERSSLYPAPEGAEWQKNNHASAWHMDLADDVRCLMSVEPNQRWWVTTHHELGHIYYFRAYSRPEVPPLLREGANRAFHEGVGSLLGMVSLHQPFLVERGLIEGGEGPTDEATATRRLLKEALDTVVFIPFSAGTMSHFEHDLYTGAVSPDSYNRAWWDHALKYQGIEPPADRGEEGCDACTKTHIINDAAQYYDYALSYVLLHQLHSHIAGEILEQDLHATNYYGNQEVGNFLRGILEKGATEDWRKVLQDALGQDLNAQPMLEYFAPLMDYLKKENEGRTHTLPSFS
ncbi:MAG: M2 family metallopeptidase [Acidobacteriota bacterium]|nr:M2 family metallopeptidase [Acidobacteriota bacterium]